MGELQMTMNTGAETVLGQGVVEAFKASLRGPLLRAGDAGYDSRPLWKRLKRRGIDLIVPHLRTRRRRWQDGRKLRRYRHRWVIERTTAWLHTFRRLVTRYEHRADIYLAFVHVACLLLTLRR